MDNKICIHSSSDEMEQRILLLMLKVSLITQQTIKQT